ncbi:unnamed protein product [Rotaria sp. Silwood1]|nr:unnamed protein product [Rotaria sp. Silwood1]CAF1573894.1 unnamed protein product [Rotaria sp. Silwood1]CAF3705621.1 unnamed protein product [Rotaria sp. Silwood1]CAF3716327.1 unnamed protein product [Rotaria sp. Silwood1]CAF4693350.1 unnamed protein product [Rotaria sp. Silwood1]
MSIQLYLLLILQLFSCFSIKTKPKLSFDEFFDYTTFPLLKFSPTGRHLLIQTKRPSWNTSSYEHTLWLYDIKNQTKKLITTNLHKTIKPQWSPSGNCIALLPKVHLSINRTNDSQTKQQSEQYIYLYSLISDELLPIEIGKDMLLAFTWSNNDSALYLAVTNSGSKADESELYKDEWKDVVQYRQNLMHRSSTIYRLNLNSHNRPLSVKRNIIRNVSSLINELLYVSFEEKLVFSSMSTINENLADFELYSIDLQNTSTLSKLTHNEALEMGLQLSIDGRHILFRTLNRTSNIGKNHASQYRLYSLNLMNGQITRLGEKFRGSIMDYTAKPNSGVYILGQLGTEVQIYTQQSPMEDLIHHNGWNGTYESIISSHYNGTIAFVYSSLEKPMEVYLINSIDQLKSAQAITNENELFTRRNLPQTKVYKWINEDDHRVIEGILHYPPDKFEFKNLPLLVLIHGGPFWASLNVLDPVWYHWATLAASEGWLVLEPNYRGSTGYGDEFLDEIRYRPLSRPGKDILFGIDQLIKDGIVDPQRLAVGGYSYGGFLTNWLITQSKRFNAALSGAGVADHTSMWGTMDLPVLIRYLFGGYPWEVPHVYQNEAPIYQLNKIRTPTHIITGEDDIRVPASQSYILERGLHYLGIPVKLLTFPKEGHTLSNNPWYRKIKAREELKWLQKYGNQSMNYNELSNNSDKSKLTYFLQFYMIFFSIVVIKNK